MKFHFIPNRNFAIPIALLLVSLFALAVAPVFAQDVTPEPTATVEPPTPVVPVIPTDSLPAEEAGTLLLSTLLGIIGSWAGSRFTAGIVGVLKLFIPEDVASATALKYLVGGLLYAGFLVATHFGFADTFTSSANALNGLVIALPPLWGVLVGSTQAHQAAEKAKLPLLGYNRS